MSILTVGSSPDRSRGMRLNLPLAIVPRSRKVAPSLSLSYSVTHVHRSIGYHNQTQSLTESVTRLIHLRGLYKSTWQWFTTSLPDLMYRLSQYVRVLDFLKLHLFVLDNTDTVSFPISLIYWCCLWNYHKNNRERRRARPYYEVCRLKVVYYESIKREIKEDLYMSIGVIQDWKPKMRNLHDSQTLG